MGRIVLIGLLAVYWVTDLRAVRVWGSEVALWQHAHAVSPLDTRSTSNFEKARYRQGVAP